MKKKIDKNFIKNIAIEEEIFISEEEIEIIKRGVYLIEKMNKNINIFIKNKL